MGIDPRTLHIGQTIAVKELNYGVQLHAPGADETGLTVVEVSREHLVLDDSADGSRRHIPLYLIHPAAHTPAPVPAPSAESA
jgi:hypothetical protein